MSESQKFVVNDLNRGHALQAVKIAPSGWIVTVCEPVRNLDQNARLHSLLADIVRAKTVWAGEQWSVEDWKFLMVHALDTHEGRPGKATVGLEGGVVLLRRSTAKMTKRELSTLIEWIESWMVKRGIPIRDTRHEAA